MRLNEPGFFLFGVRLQGYSAGKLDFESDLLRNRIPDELVIMQLRALLRELELDYFDNYRGRSRAK